jgi:hypothetical protein
MKADKNVAWREIIGYLSLDPLFKKNSVTIPVKTNDRFIYPVYNGEVLTTAVGRIAQKPECVFKKGIPGRVYG